MITVIVIDDHPIFAQGVVNALNLEPDIAVLDIKSDGEEGIEAIRELKPQVAIVDVNLPGLNGQQITWRVVKEKLPTKVVLLTAYDDIDQIIHAIRAGAAAYCAKHVDPEYLVKIVRLVMAGKYVVGDKILDAKNVKAWLNSYSDSQDQAYSDPGRPLQPLSKREMEVLLYLTQGLSNKEIALQLNISHQTVKNHVTSILRKLRVEDRTQAAVYAIRQGWVRLHDQGE